MPTVDEALAMADDSGFAIAMSELVFPRADRDGFNDLTSAERVAYCIDEVEREVNNGGFSQFFLNSSGDTAPETAEALNAIGAAAAADIVRRAIAVFPDSKPPSEYNSRTKLIEQLGDAAEDAWSSLDEEFYAYPDNLAQLLRAYVEAHRAEFRPWQ